MHISYKNRLLWQIKVTHPLVAIFYNRFTYPWRITRVPSVLYTNGTKTLWDFNITADIQELSKIQIYVDMYVTEDILKTSTQNGKEVVMHISHMKYER